MCVCGRGGRERHREREIWNPREMRRGEGDAVDRVKDPSSLNVRNSDIRALFYSSPEGGQVSGRTPRTSRKY